MAQTTTSTAATIQGERCVCAYVFQPVCGEDGQTYSNPCLADCAGAIIAASGQCAARSKTEEPVSNNAALVVIVVGSVLCGSCCTILAIVVLLRRLRRAQRIGESGPQVIPTNIMQSEVKPSNQKKSLL